MPSGKKQDPMTGGARVKSVCVGKSQANCLPPCRYVVCTRRTSYCGAVPPPRTEEQKREDVRKAKRTRDAKQPYKRVVSQEEHDRRSASAKRAAAATRARRAAALTI
jgi:hypothetical protein